jgi:hypothetical protein
MTFSGQTGPTQTLLGKWWRSISEAIGVGFPVGVNSASVAPNVVCKPAFPLGFELTNRVCADAGWAARDLVPGTHLLDSGYVDADFLVMAQRQDQIDVVGPPFGSYTRQHQTGQDDDLQAFVLDWEAQQLHCSQGHNLL